MSWEELLGLLKEQIEIEQRMVRFFTPLSKKSKNSIVRSLLHGLALDSMKHADMLQVLVELTTGALVSDFERYDLSKMLDKHVADEKDALDRIEKIISRVEDSRAQFMLSQIAADERKHHRLLEELIRISESKEVVKNEEWWEFLERNEWLF